MPYGLIVNGTLVELLDDVKYLLSPQDLMAIDYVPELVVAGTSLALPLHVQSSSMYVQSLPLYVQTLSMSMYVQPLSMPLYVQLLSLYVTASFPRVSQG